MAYISVGLMKETEIDKDNSTDIYTSTPVYSDVGIGSGGGSAIVSTPAYDPGVIVTIDDRITAAGSGALTPTQIAQVVEQIKNPVQEPIVIPGLPEKPVYMDAATVAATSSNSIIGSLVPRNMTLEAYKARLASVLSSGAPIPTGTKTLSQLVAEQKASNVGSGYVTTSTVGGGAPVAASLSGLNLWTIATVGAVGVGVYFLYKAFKKR